MYFGDGLYEEEYEDYESIKEDDSSEEDKSLDEDESSGEDNEWDKNRRSCHCNDDFCLSRITSPGWQPGQDEDDELDDDNHDCVCLCDPTDIREGTCCCNHLGLRCHPGRYDRWLEAPRVTL